MRTWIKLSAEAQSAARWQAVRGYDGSNGTPLPHNISGQALREINAKPVLFRLAVHMNKGARS